VTTREVVRYSTADSLAEAIAGRFVATVVEAQDQRGIAHVVLTGGGIGTAVLATLASSPSIDAIDWKNIHLWWGDERWENFGSVLRNDTAAHTVLIDQVLIPRHHVHVIHGPDRCKTPELSAQLYAQELTTYGDGSLPEFDVVLLGIGPDAHVASLFPEHPAARSHDIVVAVHNSPKPPAVRVSMTFPTLNHSRQAWILASGESKAQAVRLALDPSAGPLQVPASGIAASHTFFLIDDDATKELPVDIGRPGA
jgi:6-phosphogluconolactonase